MLYYDPSFGKCYPKYTCKGSFFAQYIFQHGLFMIDQSSECYSFVICSMLQSSSVYFYMHSVSLLIRRLCAAAMEMSWRVILHNSMRLSRSNIFHIEQRSAYIYYKQLKMNTTQHVILTPQRVEGTPAHGKITRPDVLSHIHDDYKCWACKTSPFKLHMRVVTCYFYA